MLSYFIFVKINSTDLGRNTPIDVFGVSLDAVADIYDEMESNLYYFSDDSDTK